MKNKVLIKLYVPELDCSFDVFVPINEIIWKLKKLMIKSVMDLTGEIFDPKKEYVLINKITSQIYKNNEVLVNTDIRNITELTMISIKK